MSHLHSQRLVVIGGRVGGIIKNHVDELLKRRVCKSTDAAIDAAGPNHPFPRKGRPDGRVIRVMQELILALRKFLESISVGLSSYDANAPEVGIGRDALGRN